MNFIVSALQTLLQRNQDAAFVALLPLVVCGMGWLLVRWITEASKNEKTALFNGQLDVITKAQALGLSDEQINKIAAEIQFRGSYSKIEKTSGEEILVAKDEKVMPDHYWSNPAMKGRAGAELLVSEARLGQILMEFETYFGENENFSETQKAWEALKDAQVRLAYSEFEGGTHAGLAATIEAIAITDKRTEELRERFEELSSR